MGVRWGLWVRQRGWRRHGYWVTAKSLGASVAKALRSVGHTDRTGHSVATNQTNNDLGGSDTEGSATVGT